MADFNCHNTVTRSIVTQHRHRTQSHNTVPQHSPTAQSQHSHTAQLQHVPLWTHLEEGQHVQYSLDVLSHCLIQRPVSLDANRHIR